MWTWKWNLTNSPSAARFFIHVMWPSDWAQQLLQPDGKGWAVFLPGTLCSYQQHLHTAQERQCCRLPSCPTQWVWWGGGGGGGDIYGDGDFLQLTMHGILLDMGAFGFHVKDPRAVEKEVSMWECQGKNDGFCSTVATSSESKAVCTLCKASTHSYTCHCVQNSGNKENWWLGGGGGAEL